jgi:mRNA-degrading endonuclease RelE of RelBE toxin-antitoxin system
MKVFYTPEFKGALRRCNPQVEKKLYKQVAYLTKNLRHPSLHAKKYDEMKGLWQARVDRNYRFYFLIKGSTYILLDIRAHPK